jgi:hypothetical protein
MCSAVKVSCLLIFSTERFRCKFCVCRNLISDIRRLKQLPLDEEAIDEDVQKCAK